MYNGYSCAEYDTPHSSCVVCRKFQNPKSFAIGSMRSTLMRHQWSPWGDCAMAIPRGRGHPSRRGRPFFDAIPTYPMVSSILRKIVFPRWVPEDVHLTIFFRVNTILEVFRHNPMNGNLALTPAQTSAEQNVRTCGSSLTGQNFIVAFTSLKAVFIACDCTSVK